MGERAVAEPPASVSYADEILEHLVAMASDPGWKTYAWHAAKHYEELDPFRLQGMQERLKQRMQQEMQKQ